MSSSESVPRSWAVVPLSDLLTTLETGSRPKGGVRDITSGVPSLGGEHLNSAGGFRLGKVRYVSAEFAAAMTRGRISTGDILVVKDGATTGRVAFVEASFPFSDAVVNEHLFICRCASTLDKKFVFYYLLSGQGGQQILEDFRGAAQGGISQRFANLVRVPLAPRDEQTRIVEKLEELLSDLDAGVAELKTAQRKLAQYRQSLLKAAVEGALTADWRAAHGEMQETGAELLQRILSERRIRWEQKQIAKFAEQGKPPPKGWQATYSEPITPDLSGLPPLPEGWVWTTAEQLCEFITKGTTPPKSLDDGSEKAVPFLRVTNLTSTGELNFSDRVFVSRGVHEGFLARSVVYPNDVLMNIVGPPLGQVSIVPSDFTEWNINQAIAIFRAVEGVLPAFVAACLLSPTAQKWLKGRAKTTAGQTNLTLEVCRELPLPLPPMHEQQAVVEQLDAQLVSLSAQLDAVDLALKQAVAQRKNLLKTAFAGQLVLQDPNDEPVSELLARIRAARASNDGHAPRRRRKSA